MINAPEKLRETIDRNHLLGRKSQEGQGKEHLPSKVGCLTYPGRTSPEESNPSSERGCLGDHG